MKKEKLAERFSIGLFVAVIDESIQILSDRVAAVVDLLVDYSGYLTATIVFFLVVLVVKLIKKSKTKTD